MDIGYVKTQGVNVRARPGGKTVDALTKGDRVEILGRSQPGKLPWYQIRSKRGEGYVVAEAISFSHVPPRPAPLPPDIEPYEPLERLDHPSAKEIWWTVCAGITIVLMLLLLAHLVI